MHTEVGVGQHELSAVIVAVGHAGRPVGSDPPGLRRVSVSEKVRAPPETVVGLREICAKAFAERRLKKKMLFMVLLVYEIHREYRTRA